jgi:hypothetical protein
MGGMVGAAYFPHVAEVGSEVNRQLRKVFCHALLGRPSQHPQDRAWCNSCTSAPIMVTVHRGAGWKIAVYGREHGVPHFHVEGPGYRCSVTIATREVIVGSAPPAVLRAARAWARENQKVLIGKWQELNR